LRAIKRLLDILASLIALTVFALPMLLIALLVRAQMGTPVLFRQTRPGLGGKPFMMMKFRTMRNAHDKNGTPLPDAERITSLGQFLRRTSLDELPEFINVLKGDMSLVGPRPLLMQYLDRYTPEQARRHEVKPGVTGWAQINGRNAISWDERFKMDVWYVDHWSLWLDFKILVLSLVKVLKREGISADGHATMPEFMGE
jgi:sugar transferase EpsL